MRVVQSVEIIRMINPKAMIEGLKNYKNDTDIPEERLKALRECKHNIDAPIKALRIKDRYEETDGKICGKCWCAQPLKARQNIEKCECWT